MAVEINQTLFNPPLENPIKTLDLPIAGKLYSAQTLPLIVDMIGILVGETRPDGPLASDDTNGERTIEVLKKVRKIVFSINSNHASSLGLHPAVYFYSQEGRYKSSAFLAMIDFVAKLVDQNRLNEFIRMRAKFERFTLGGLNSEVQHLII